MQKSLESIVIEVRERLRACQFYIRSNQPVQFNIELFHNKVILNEDYSVNVKGLISINSTSLTGLEETERTVTFRAQTEPSGPSGSFKTEVLNLETAQSYTYKPEIIKNVPLDIYCQRCNLKLTTEQFTISRLLPLPSCGLEAGDFFCHKSDNEKLQIAPKLNDCLYSVGYLCFKPELLRLKGSTLCCPCCSSILGSQNSSVMKLWTSDVLLLEHLPQNSKDNTLETFITIINHCIHNSAIPQATKILLYCKYITKEKHYLLIWILEKCLKILQDLNIKEQIILEECFRRKVLYRFETNETPEVEEYSEDPCINIIECSPSIMQSAVNYLQTNSKFLPDNLKKHNSMFISYIEIKTQVNK